MFHSNIIKGSMPLLPSPQRRKSDAQAPLRRTSSEKERLPVPVPAPPPPPSPTGITVAPPTHRTNSDDYHDLPKSVLGTKRRVPYVPGSDAPGRRVFKRANQSPLSSADTIAAVMCFDDDEYINYKKNSQPHPNLFTPKLHMRDPKPLSLDDNFAKSIHSIPQQSSPFHQTNRHERSHLMLCATNLDIPTDLACKRPPCTVTGSENNTIVSNNVNSSTSC